jgi:hypothetical protein
MTGLAAVIALIVYTYKSESIPDMTKSTDKPFP